MYSSLFCLYSILLLGASGNNTPGDEPPRPDYAKVIKTLEDIRPAEFLTLDGDVWCKWSNSQVCCSSFGHVLGQLLLYLFDWQGDRFNYQLANKPELWPQSVNAKEIASREEIEAEGIVPFDTNGDWAQRYYLASYGCRFLFQHPLPSTPDLTRPPSLSHKDTHVVNYKHRLLLKCKKPRKPKVHRIRQGEFVDDVVNCDMENEASETGTSSEVDLTRIRQVMVDTHQYCVDMSPFESRRHA